MFASILEKVTVGLLSALVLALIYWIWELAKSVPSQVLLPENAVVAFNSECPRDGWAPYEIAQGRFIMGRDNNMGLEERGGSLLIPQDGEHNHGVQSGKNEFGGRFGNDNNDDDWSTIANGTHNHGGENRPPFIALNFCQKL